MDSKSFHPNLLSNVQIHIRSTLFYYFVVVIYTNAGLFFSCPLLFIYVRIWAKCLVWIMYIFLLSFQQIAIILPLCLYIYSYHWRTGFFNDKGISILFLFIVPTKSSIFIFWLTCKNWTGVVYISEPSIMAHQIVPEITWYWSLLG